LGRIIVAWFVIDAVEQMDLSGFYAAYRADGHGRAAYEPSLMVDLVRVRDWCAVLARDGASLPGACCVSGDYRELGS